ncbi:MAG: glucosyltransferase domain-containing protein [Clostridia bacterium]|nr:glucosyltransferase domain-containing protein [Clostridia bacterium]
MRKKEVLIFIAIFCTAMLSTIFFLKPHYSIDTVEFLNNGYDTYIQSKFLVDGRIFSVLLLKLIIDLPMKFVIPILYIIGVLISCIAVMYIKNLIVKYAKLEGKLNIIPTIISYLIIFNFMYIDAFQFMELPIIAISVLLFIISAKNIIEKNILKSFILALIAMFCYQGTINVFIVTAFVISIIENKRLNKKVIIDMLKAGGILLITIGINYVFTEIVGGTGRLTLDLIENCKNALINLYMLIFSSSNHYPQYLQLTFVAIITLYCFAKDIKILNLLWIYIISIVVNIILLITTGNGVMPVTTQYGRIFFTIGAAIGYMFMYIWCVSDVIRKDKAIKVILIIYFATVLLTYLQYTYFYMKGQYIDEYIITNIDNVISKYEEQTGNKVEKYCYKIDFDNYDILDTLHILNKKYDKMIYGTIIEGRRSLEGISSALFLLHSDRIIEKVVEVEDFSEKYFPNINFENIELFDERRFVFIGDTVYIML